MKDNVYIYIESTVTENYIYIWLNKKKLKRIRVKKRTNIYVLWKIYSSVIQTKFKVRKMVDKVSINCLFSPIETQMTLIFKMFNFQKIVQEKDKFYWRKLNNNNNKKTNSRIIDMKFRSKGKA